MKEKKSLSGEPRSIQEQAYDILIKAEIQPKVDSFDKMDSNTSMAIVNLNKLGLYAGGSKLDYLLKSPEMDKAFTTFLKQQNSLENLSCYKDIQSYKNEKNPIEKAQLGKDIFVRYCNGSESPMEINIDEKATDEIKKTIFDNSQFEEDLFDNVERTLMTNLNDSYSVFTNKSLYNDTKLQAGIATNSLKDCLNFLLLDNPKSKEFESTINQLSESCDKKLHYSRSQGLEPIEKIEKTLANYQNHIVDSSYAFLQGNESTAATEDFKKNMDKGKQYLKDELPSKLQESLLNSLLIELAAIVEQLTNLVKSIAQVAKGVFSEAPKESNTLKNEQKEEQKQPPVMSAPPSTLSSKTTNEKLESSTQNESLSKKSEPKSIELKTEFTELKKPKISEDEPLSTSLNR